MIRMLAVLFVVLLCAAGASAEPNMQEGKWEMTVKMDMSGMPNMPITIPPTTFTQCLTKKDLVPQKAEKNTDCKMISNKIEGNTVTWVVQCNHKDGSVTDSDGKITYKGASFDGVINMTMKGGKRGGGPGKMSNKISGKRIGDCAKE